jgi:hypothetical protein
MCDKHFSCPIASKALSPISTARLSHQIMLLRNTCSGLYQPKPGHASGRQYQSLQYQAGYMPFLHGSGQGMLRLLPPHLGDCSAQPGWAQVMGDSVHQDTAPRPHFLRICINNAQTFTDEVPISIPNSSIFSYIF